MLVKQEDGSEIEVFTAEELEAQKQEAIAQFKAENPDKTEELTKLQLELEGYKSKDMNFGNLRKAKEDAEKKVEEILKGVDEKINSVKKEVLEGVNKDHFNDNLKAFTGGDEELEKKVKFEYENTLKGVIPNSKKEITSKLKSAYILATAKEPDAVNMNVFGSGGVSRFKINNANQKFSPEEVELGRKFGLKDEDFKQQ